MKRGAGQERCGRHKKIGPRRQSRVASQLYTTTERRKRGSVAALLLVLLLLFAEHGLGQVSTLLLFLLLVVTEEGLGEVAALLLFLLLVVASERRRAERHQQRCRHDRQHHLLHTDYLLLGV